MVDGEDGDNLRGARERGSQPRPTVQTFHYIYETHRVLIKSFVVIAAGRRPPPPAGAFDSSVASRLSQPNDQSHPDT